MGIRALDASLFYLFEGSFIRRTLVSQVKFTSSNSLIEILEKGVEYVDVALVFLRLTWNIFHTFFSSISIGYFEQVNISGVTSKLLHGAAKHTSSLQCSDWFWTTVNFGEWKPNGGIY